MQLTMEQAIYIIVGTYSFLALMFAFTFYWMHKNSLEIKIAQFSDGATISKAGRYRFVKGKYYPIWDMFRRSPLEGMTHHKLKDWWINSEGLPLIGIKKTVYVYVSTIDQDKPEYVPFCPPLAEDLPDYKITDTMLSFINSSMMDTWERTRPKMTAEEWAKQVFLPLGVMVLAALCLVFYPKIYESIKAQANPAIGVATGKLGELITGVIPV